MFVRTENHGIINLSCFPQVDVVGYSGVWRLQAFYQKSPNAPTFSVSGFPLAEFKEEIEARYSFCRLYSALEAGESVWGSAHGWVVLGFMGRGKEGTVIIRQPRDIGTVGIGDHGFA